jgi:hypothetical protein
LAGYTQWFDKCCIIVIEAVAKQALQQPLSITWLAGARGCRFIILGRLDHPWPIRPLFEKASLDCGVEVT